MEEIRSPEHYTNRPRLYLAGSIIDCVDWRRHIIKKLSHCDITVFNPKQAQWLSMGFELAEQDIWVNTHLPLANMILFWFSNNTLPLGSLIELGMYLKDKKIQIFVGIEKGFGPKKLVEEFCSTYRPEIEIVHSIDLLANQVERRIKY